MKNLQPAFILMTTQWIFLPAFVSSTMQYMNPISPLWQFLKDGTNELNNELPDQDSLLLEYDFIVVGAGTAGCVIANRLTEIPEWKVLLVEAGISENFVMDIPLFANYLQFTTVNWKYITKPSNKYCTGFEKKQCNWPRGKVVGGSSILNYMIYTRGSVHDYNNWESLGNEGWGWNDVLPYFKKIETFNIPIHDDIQYHGYNGNLNIEHVSYRTSKSKAWVQGAQELGFTYNDCNGPNAAGVSFVQASMKNGTRHSSNRAYLHSIKRRNNLHLSKVSMVTKLIFDSTKTKVIGIEFEKHGKQYKILTKKEVIISAGAINSPQLLMLSGIGPKNHLESLDIPVIKDLPVGYNLMDHIAASGVQFTVKKQRSSVTTPYIFNHLELVFKWMKNHEGPLTLPGGCEALVFLELTDKLNVTGWPDIELLFTTGGLNSDPLLRKNLGFAEPIFSNTYGPLDDQDVFMVLPMLLRPKSKGRLLLQNRNPRTHPVLIPNYFEYAEDLQKIVEGIKVAIEISRQPSMKKIETKLYDVPIADCLKYGPFGSDAYFACQARMFTMTIYHQSGTCKMGPENDPSTVVDPRLRVHGISNLRVIDASIMPEITTGHINAPTYMIAEKGSDIIKEDWGRKL